MRCPALSELHPPPAAGIGWPWAEESPQLPATMPDGSPWPRISIVTPSFNQGQYIEETIRSVLLQGYPNLEYIIIDGGSTDNSVEIIKKYEKWLTYWVSEADRGQSHAINKGFNYCSGEIFQWINSDDCLCERALKCVGSSWTPQTVVAGGVENIHLMGPSDITYNLNLTARGLIKASPSVIFHQPGIFWPTDILREIQPSGIAREDLHYIFDWYLLVVTLIMNNDKVFYCKRILSQFRLHQQSKTVSKHEAFNSERRYVRALLANDTISDRLEKDLRYELRKIKTRNDITTVLHRNKTAWTIALLLLEIVIRNPRSLIDIYYWKAIKRVIHHRIIRAGSAIQIAYQRNH